MIYPFRHCVMSLRVLLAQCNPQQFPTWIVCVVYQHINWFPDQDFFRCGVYPSTYQNKEKPQKTNS